MSWSPSPADLLLILFVVTGIFGTFLPVLPGPSIIVAGALLHGLLTCFQPLTLFHIMLLAMAALAAWAGQYLLTALGGRHFGGSSRASGERPSAWWWGFFCPWPAACSSAPLWAACSLKYDDPVKSRW